MRPVLAIAAATLCTTGLLAGAAKGAYDPVATGSTEISFSNEFLRTLRIHGVKLQVRGGRDRGGRVALPASGGSVDAGLGTGTVESAGSIVFSSGEHKVVLRKLAFKAKRSPLEAKVGGNKLKLVTGARLVDSRAGFGAVFTAAGLHLSPKFATRLNKKLGLGRALVGGQSIGSLRVESQPATVHLRPLTRVDLGIDPAFAAKLDRLFVSLNPIAPAELSAGPTLSLPIGEESVLAPDGDSGTLKLGGQLELLQLGSAQMFWREIWLQLDPGGLLVETDVEPAPPHPGVAPQAPLLALPPGGSSSANPRARTIAVAGRGVVLSGAAAELLNHAFTEEGSEPVFAEGESVGSISFTADAD